MKKLLKWIASKYNLILVNKDSIILGKNEINALSLFLVVFKFHYIHKVTKYNHFNHIR